MIDNEKIKKAQELIKEFAAQVQISKDFNDKLLAFKYCYDRAYIPNWDNENEGKWSVYYNCEDNAYCTTLDYTIKYPNVIYFSSEDVASMCCDWLNGLKEEEK